jgi:pimeloyl-ACP methyl ester carboxylesterase
MPAVATAEAPAAPPPPAAPAPAPAAPTPPPPPAAKGAAPGPYSALVELKAVVETERTISATGERKLVRLPVVATIPQLLTAAATTTTAAAGEGGAPAAAATAPVVVLIGGFQSRASMYRPLARRLASHGYAVLQYNAPLLKIVPDAEELPFLGAACGWLRRRVDGGGGGGGGPQEEGAPPSGAPLVPPSTQLDWGRAAVAGHSRGGKLAALHYARGFEGPPADAADAAADGTSSAPSSSSSSSSSFVPRFRACFLIDPVDNTPFTPESALYPSAARALRALGGGGKGAAAAAAAATTTTAAAPTSLPLAAPLACATPAAAAAAMAATAKQPPPPAPRPKIALVAAGLAGPSNPEGSNWRLFADAAAEALPGSRVAVLPDAGHTSFMSAPPGGAVGAALLDALFGGGGARGSVLDRTAAAAVAWLDAELGVGGGGGGDGAGGGG